MTPPNTNRPPTPPQGRRFWRTAAITLGVGTLLVGTVAVVGAWVFINRGLTPLLEERLSALLERELELGELEALSWNGLRVSSATLHATETDPTYATAESVEVGFNPFQVLFRRKLEIDLRLVGAEGYLEQHPTEGWLGLDVPTFEPVEDPLVKVRMDDIEVVDSQIILVPLAADGQEPIPLRLTEVNSTVAIEPMEVAGRDSQRVEFNAIATPPNGGNLDITGGVFPIEPATNSDQPLQQEIKLGIGGKGVAAESVMAFLLPTIGQKNLPLATTAGRVSGQWTLTFLPNQPVTVEGAGSLDNGQMKLTSVADTGPWGNTIDNIDVTARFKGTTITLDSASANYEILTAQATGTVNWNGEYDLVAQVDDVDLEDILEQSEVESSIVLSGLLGSNVAITGPMLQPKIAAKVEAIGPVTVDRIILDELTTDVVLQSDRIETLLHTLNVTNVEASPALGGKVTGSGVIDLAQQPDSPTQLEFEAEVQGVSGDAIASLYDVPQLPVTLGLMGAIATISGPLGALETSLALQAPNLAYGGQVYPTSGTAIFANGGLSIPQAVVQVGTGTVIGQGNVGNDSWQANLVANNVNLRSFAPTLPGSLNADVALSGPIQGASLANMVAQGTYNLLLADGAIQGDAALTGGRWRTDATLNALGLGQFSPQLRGNTSGTVSLAGRTDALTLADLRGQGDLDFSAGLAGFSPQLAGFDTPLSSQFAWTGQELLIERASSAQLEARGVVSPQLEGNQVQGIRGFVLDLDAQRYPLALLPTPVPLDGYGSFSGRVVGTPSTPQLNGSLLLEEFAVNQVAFDPALLGPVSYQPQTGLQVGLVGQSDLDTPDAIAIDFQNSRSFGFDVSWQGAAAAGYTDGNQLRTTLKNLPLQALGLPAVNPLGGPPRGLLSSQGEWVVDLNRQTFAGDLLVTQPGLGYITAQQLTAQVEYRDRQFIVNQGELVFDGCSEHFLEDELPAYCSDTAGLGRVYSFNGDVQLDTLAYNANVNVKNGNVGDVLAALAITELEDFSRAFQPPEWLENPPPAEAIPEILATRSAGNAQATLLDQLRRLAEIQTLQEQVAEAEAGNPIPLLAELQGRFDAQISLSGTPQQLPEVMFDLAGEDWRWGSDFVADKVIAQGQLAEGNLTLQPIRLETALPPDAEGNSQVAFVNLAGNLSLVDEEGSSLQLVSEQLPVAAVQDIFNLPIGLEGRLNALANFSGGLGNPTVRGEIVLANGSINRQPLDKAEGLFLYENARLLLLGELTQVDNDQPLKLQGDIPYAFGFMTVQPADDRIALTLDVEDEGLALLNVLNNQVTWESGEGKVSLVVGGQLFQPTISGVMEVENAVLRSQLLPDPLTDLAGRIVFENNQIVVQTLEGKYGNGRLQAIGALPIGFPPIISVVELAALGADQEVPAQESPEANASDPLATNQADDDPVVDIPVPTIAAETTTPVASLDPSQPPMHPSGALTITLDEVDLELRGIYQGGVEGQVVVGGSVLFGGPQLGGVVTLANGRLFLPEGNTEEPTATVTDEISPFTPKFENLKLTLADNIQIQQSNLLNVVAQGDLRLTGPLRPFGAIEPKGTIRLRSGQINLLTTTFRLAGRDNVARFSPERGIANPLLDVRLRTSVTETQQGNVVEASAFASSEVTDAPVISTGVETIRIRATYRGTASNLLESLFVSDISDTVIELSSSPPRSRQEIINLLSGSYIAALQSGQGVLNFFGGALLSRAQDFIRSSLNLSEFRLFPVTAASRFSNDDNTGSGLDVATEVGFDLTNNLTLSLVKILTESTPTEFNLRYRLSDEFTIRSTTNFDDINRVLLEFETRF